MTLDAESLFRTSPFHRWLNCDIERMDEEEVVLKVSFREEFVGDPERSFYHGGVLSAVIDAAGTFAMIAATDRDWITVDMRVDFQRPAGPETLTARARPLKVGRNLGLADVIITDGDDRTVASGRLSLAAVREAADRGATGGDGE